MGRFLHFLSKITALRALWIHIHEANKEGVYVHTFRETCVSLNFFKTNQSLKFYFIFFLISKIQRNEDERNYQGGCFVHVFHRLFVHRQLLS